jgi:hypothetical protein
MIETEKNWVDTRGAYANGQYSCSSQHHGTKFSAAVDLRTKYCTIIMVPRYLDTVCLAAAKSPKKKKKRHVKHVNMPKRCAWPR